MNIQIEQLQKAYASKIALNIHQLSIEKGEVVGIVGDNGAGKTTLFRILLNLIKADDGKIYIDGEGHNKNEDWKYRCGAFVDSSFLVEFLTPEEYYDLVGKIYKMKTSEIGEQLEKYSSIILDDILGQKKFIRDFSAGNKQKIGIIGAMLAQPELLILDEPFNFLDPSSQLAMTDILSQYSDTSHATILISSHNLEYISRLCTRILLLERGEIIRDIDNENRRAEVELKDYFSGKRDNRFSAAL